MDAKLTVNQALEILDNYGEGFIGPYNTRPNVWTARKQIAQLIQSLAAKAALADKACTMIDNLDCQGKFSEEECGEDAIECECVDFCRLRAGGGQK